jgi:hypothetical protein
MRERYETSIDSCLLLQDHFRLNRGMAVFVRLDLLALVQFANTHA